MAETTAAPAKVRNRRIGLVIAVVIGGILALNLLAGGIDHAVGGSEPSGVTGSSYGTQADGLGGFATLLAHYGYPVARQRGSLDGVLLDPRATVFVIEPQALTDAEAASLFEFAARGGRLVIGGDDPFYLHRFRDRPPTWSSDGPAIYREIEQFDGVRTVETAGRGSFTEPGSSTVLVSNGDRALLTTERVGRGVIAFLADASPLENGYLTHADNAAFALQLAGDAPRPVIFAEGVHGFGARRGLGALPIGWRIALVLLAAAAVAFAWSRGRRFGPPDRPSREMLPARAEYVGALAVSLERTHDPARALAPMQVWARTRVAQRAHLAPDASLEAIDRAAIALGFSEAERAVIWHPTTDDDSALVLGRVVARLSQQDGSTP